MHGHRHGAHGGLEVEAADGADAEPVRDVGRVRERRGEADEADVLVEVRLCCLLVLSIA